MKNYSQIAKRYLRFQKKRTILTVTGVAISVILLFAMLTVYFSYFLNNREAVRKETDYEIVLYTDDISKINDIKGEDFVKSTYTGEYVIEADVIKPDIRPAVFINSKNPYRTNKYFDYLTDKYDVKGTINDVLASYYLQGDIGNVNYIIFLLFMACSFFFAVIGIGIIRNSIQLNCIEQIKDYGILRCIGSTKQQLKHIIFMMGFYMEITGILIGMLLGFPVAVVVGHVLGVKVKLHIVPILYVLVAYMFDLYFVMSENAKLVKRISPVEAVRGNYKVSQQKIKRRRKGLFGRIFGIEGEYAYKSLMANKGRFFKSVAVFCLGITACISISAVLTFINGLNNEMMKAVGDYQICLVGREYYDRETGESKRIMPGKELLDIIEGDSAATASRKIYNTNVQVCDIESNLSKYENGIAYNSASELIKGQINLYGYEKDELKDYERLLVDGTLDVSPDGIIIAQGEYTFEDEDSLYMSLVKKNNYSIGDKLEIFNKERFDELYYEGLKDIPMPEDPDEESHKDYKKRIELEDALVKQCYETLLKEKAYKQYTVEGIVKYEKDKTGVGILNAILPIESYYDITGYTAKDYTGIKYKLDGDLSRQSEKLLLNAMYDVDVDSMILSEYVEISSSLRGTKQTMFYIFVFIVFLVFMSSLNIINTEASNLYIRRQELAQLRVIGVTKRKLCYMVLLEGIITALVANIAAFVLGQGICFYFKKAFYTFYRMELSLPIWISVVGFIVSTLILCGATYFPIMKMKDTVLEEINASGE